MHLSQIAEIEPVIAFKLRMVQVVVSGSGQYFEQQGLPEPFGQNFIPQVPVYIDHEEVTAKSITVMTCSGRRKTNMITTAPSKNASIK